MQRVCNSVPLLRNVISTGRLPIARIAGTAHRIQVRSSFLAKPRLLESQRFLSTGNVEDDSGKYKIATVPNALCVARIATTPVIGFLVVNHSYTPAFSLFVLAGLTDLLDGYIARNFRGQKSLLGSVLDPMADKLLVSVMFLTMTHVNLIPLPLTAVVILRDVCLIVGGFYKRYKTMSPPYSLNRFFNPEVSSMQIVPTLISKINTMLQLTVVAASLAGPVFEFGPTFDLGLSVLYWTTAGTTVYSGLQYASGRAFKKV